MNLRVDHNALRLRRDVHRLWLLIDHGAVTALALFLVFAVFLPLALYLALTVPVLFLVLAFVMVVMAVVMRQAGQGSGNQRGGNAERENGKNLVHRSGAQPPKPLRQSFQSAQA